jgi:PAS domain S-box-containing protein/diguanylate cyclase (GGDEF)-like protein
MGADCNQYGTRGRTLGGMPRAVAGERREADQPYFGWDEDTLALRFKEDPTRRSILRCCVGCAHCNRTKDLPMAKHVEMQCAAPVDDRRRHHPGRSSAPHQPGGWNPGAHEAGLRRAQQMAKLAHVVTGPVGEFLAWSETLPAMLGRDAATVPTTTRGWLELLHPDDRERFRRTAIDAARRGTRAELEYRLRGACGEWLHIREIMEPLDRERDSNAGRRWLSTLQDVSAAKQAARALRASEEHYRATFEQAAVGIAETSLKGELRFVNQTFCLMVDYSRAEAQQLHIRDLTHPRDIRSSLEARARMISAAAPPHQRELRLRRKDGSFLWVDATTSLVRAPDNRPLHFVTVLSDISERKHAEEEASRFRAAMDVTADAIFLADPRTMRLLYVNETACSRLGYTREQLLEIPLFKLLGKTRAQLVLEHEEVIAAGERGKRTENRYVRGDGSRRWSELHRRAFSAPDGVMIVTVARDITERKVQQEKIERLSRVHAMLSGIHSAIVRLRDRDALFRDSCRIAQEAGGFDLVWIGLIDQSKMLAEPVAWHGDEESVRYLRAMRFPIRERSRVTLLTETMRTRKPAVTNDARNDPRVDNTEAAAARGINSAAFLPLIVADSVAGVMVMCSPVSGHFDEAEVKLLSQLAADISFALEHIEKSERAAYLALYDELTGLPNRRLFSERLSQFVHAAGDVQGKLALALLDLERLRAVNKQLGWRAGDEVLREVSRRLREAAGAEATGRTASNHFAVALRSVRDRSEAERMLATIIDRCFAEPYAVDGTELKLGVKAGLAMFPGDCLDSETLLVNAEAALRKAKTTGERTFFYTPDVCERTGAWLPLESKLGGALERNEFTLHYQPKVDAVTRRVVGLEALLRWNSPELGVVPPAKFIPLMEETGMILEVGTWALRRAALDHRLWAEQGFGQLRIAVNVSDVQLRQRDFVQAVQQAIRDGGEPTSIDLEITESLIMRDVEESIRKLNEVRALGVQIAIDDFGTGYSSLGYLAKLPVQALKIDRSFISAMLTDPAAMTLVQTIISLCHTLGPKVIAEGVEEEEQAKYLRLLRCDEIQGYLISKPQPFDEMTRFLHASRADQTQLPAGRPADTVRMLDP